MKQRARFGKYWKSKHYVRKNQTDSLFAWLLLLPALFVVSIFAFYPLLRCLMASLFTQSTLARGEVSFVGLTNYLSLFRDLRFFSSLWNTLLFTVASVSLEMVLGLVFALIVNESFRGRGLVRASALIPWVLPTAVMAMAWRWIFNDTYGVFGAVLGRLGFISGPVAWLGDPSLAMSAAVMADVWKTTPFVMLVLLAGLSAIPQDYYEAMEIEGAGSLAKLWWLVLPILKPYLVVALVFRLIQAFGIFDLIWVLTGGGPGGATKTVSLYIYDTIFRYLNLGYGATITVVAGAALFAVVCAVTVVGKRDD